MDNPAWLAKCLGRISRFGGQHPESNVLRHSLEVWHLCRAFTPAEKLWALYHDAHEVVSGDVTRVCKNEGTKEFQRVADETLKQRLGVAGEFSRVAMADTLHGDMEARELSLWVRNPSFSSWSYSVGYYSAEHEFLYRIENLRNQI